MIHSEGLNILYFFINGKTLTEALQLFWKFQKVIIFRFRFCFEKLERNCESYLEFRNYFK